MKTNNLKWMKATGIVVIFVCCFWIGLGSILDVLNATVINGGYMKWNPERITWQRYIILGYTIKEKPDDRFYEMMKQMRSIAHNLNQLTVKAHSLGFIDELSLIKQMELWIKFMDEIKEEFLINKKGE